MAIINLHCILLNTFTTTYRQSGNRVEKMGHIYERLNISGKNRRRKLKCMRKEKRNYLVRRMDKVKYHILSPKNKAQEERRERKMTIKTHNLRLMYGICAVDSWC